MVMHHPLQAAPWSEKCSLGLGLDEQPLGSAALELIRNPAPGTGAVQWAPAIFFTYLFFLMNSLGNFFFPPEWHNSLVLPLPLKVSDPKWSRDETVVSKAHLWVISASAVSPLQGGWCSSGSAVVSQSEALSCRCSCYPSHVLGNQLSREAGKTGWWCLWWLQSPAFLGCVGVNGDSQPCLLSLGL